MSDDVKPWEVYAGKPASAPTSTTDETPPWQTPANAALSQPAPMPTAAADIAQPAAPAGPQRTRMQQLERALGLAARMPLQAATSTAGMIGDALNTAVNMGGQAIGHNPHLGMPSQAIQQGINSVLPVPETTGEKVGDFVGSMVAGGYGKGVDPLARLMTRNVTPAPVAQATTRQQNVLDAQAHGFAFTPSQNEGRLLPTIAEGLAGSPALTSSAVTRNQKVVDRLVSQATGMPEGADLGYIDHVINQTYNEGYGPLKSLGKITTGGAYRKALDNVLSDFQGASGSFPGAANNDVRQLVDSFRVPAYTGDDAVTMIKGLRKDATRSYGQDNGALGGAQRAIAKALEDNIDLNLVNPRSSAYQTAVANGDNPTELLGNFRDARKLLAQQHVLEKVYDPGTGSADALKLAAMLRRRKPLTDGLADAAKFAATAPKLAGIPKQQSSPTNSMLSGLPAAITGLVAGPMAGAAVGAAPIGRAGLRAFLLSDAGQRWAGPHLDPNILARLGRNPSVLNAVPTGINQLENGLYGE